MSDSRDVTLSSGTQGLKLYESILNVTKDHNKYASSNKVYSNTHRKPGAIEIRNFTMPNCFKIKIRKKLDPNGKSNECVKDEEPAYSNNISGVRGCLQRLIGARVGTSAQIRPTWL